MQPVHSRLMPAPPNACPAAEPWEQPAGDLRVTLRYPSCLLTEATISCCLAPQPVHLLGSGDDAVAAALAAGSVAAALNRRREAADMQEEQAAAACVAEAAGDAGSDAGNGTASLRRSTSGPRHPTAVCLTVAAGSSASPAAAAVLRALRRRVPGLAAVCAASNQMLDDEWAALSQANVIVVDCPVAGSTPAASAAGVAAAQQEEAAIVAVWSQLASAGLLELLWQRFWAGALLVGVGQGCALLGRGGAPAAAGLPVLPWYCLRAGSAGTGWVTLHAALVAAGGIGGSHGAGVLAGGCWVADPWSGQAEMLVAPSRDVLVAAAAAAAAQQDSQAGLEEADYGDAFGFLREVVRPA